MKSVHRNTLSRVFASATIVALGIASPAPELSAADGSKVRRDPSGSIRAYYNPAPHRYAGSPESAARSFLRDQSDFQKVEAISTIATVAINRAPGGTHVRFRQLYAGIPVYRGDVVVSLNDRNEIAMAVSNARRNIALPTVEPAFTPTRAIELTRTLLGARGNALGSTETCELVLYPAEGGEALLAYRVTMVLEDPAGDWEILLDAKTGAELRREDRYVKYRTDAGFGHGTGSVFLLNPLSAARRQYGDTGFVNNDDAESDSLNNYRAVVALDSLLFVDGLYHLEGPACTVTQIEYPDDPIAYTSPTPGGFQFSRGEWGFEAVMAYYHVTAAYRRFTELGFALDGLRGLHVDPHGYQGKDNSHYSPSGNWLAFGTGGVQDAEDAEVIWHEYAHAIQYNIVPTWGGGETPALGEGYGDYWAASYARSLSQWRDTDPQYQWVFGWDGHNPYWSGRMLNDTRTYPFPAGSIHIAGQIWASTLLSIRADLGRTVTDRLVLKSLYYLGSEATAVDAAQALLQADRDLYAGAHLPTLMYWLETVKKFLSTGDSVTILLVNDDPIALGASSASGDRGGPGEPRQTFASAFPNLPIVDSIAVQSTSFAALDTGSLAAARILILTAGNNPAPFNDQVKRSAIVNFVRRGGRILIEGGEVASFYRPASGAAETDADFRSSLLHVARYAGNGEGCDLTSGPDPEGFFSQPHRLPSLITFRAGAGPADRDFVLAERSPSVNTIGKWSDERGTGALIAKNGTDGSVQSLFLPIALSALNDTLVARTLMENAISYLLYHQASTQARDGAVAGMPEEFLLHQNYPNPFNPSTHIMFDLQGQSYVRLSIYNMLGQQVLALVDENMQAGRHEVVWDGRDAGGAGVASGMYLMRLDVNSENGQQGTQSRSMVLLR